MRESSSTTRERAAVLEAAQVLRNTLAANHARVFCQVVTPSFAAPYHLVDPRFGATTGRADGVARLLIISRDQAPAT
jgi:hypothetical protein